jgi:hypothetical protein
VIWEWFKIAQPERLRQGFMAQTLAFEMCGKNGDGQEKDPAADGVGYHEKKRQAARTPAKIPWPRGT